MRLMILICAHLQVLQKAMQHEISEKYFNEPVDPEALGLPEYRKIIKVHQYSFDVDTNLMHGAA